MLKFHVFDKISKEFHNMEEATELIETRLPFQNGIQQ